MFPIRVDSAPAESSAPDQEEEEEDQLLPRRGGITDQGSSERRVCRIMASFMARGFVAIPNDAILEEKTDLLENEPFFNSGQDQEQEEEHLLTRALLRMRFPHVSSQSDSESSESEEAETTQVSDSEGEILACSQPDHLDLEESKLILDQETPRGQGDHGFTRKTNISTDSREVEKASPKSKKAKKWDPAAEGEKLFCQAMDQVLDAME